MKSVNLKSKNKQSNKAELYRVSVAEPLQIFKNGDDLVANWDSVKWKDCIKIGLAIAAPASAILGIDQSQISYEEIHEIDEGHCRASVAFLANHVETTLIESNKQKLDKAISSFIDYVYRENGRNLDLFEPNLTQDDFESVVHEHATNFLLENGGGKISAPILISSSSLNKICTGNFSQKPTLHPSDQAKEIFVGQIISMFCEKTEFVVKCEFEKDIRIAYKKNIFFHELKQMLGEPIIGTFCVHKSTDANHRSFYVLDKIDEKRTGSGPLI